MNKSSYLDSEQRPWGNFFVIHEMDNYKIKRIEVDPGKRLSYQYHNSRSEVWVIINGEGKIVLNEEIIKNKKGDSINIPKRTKHRIENTGKEKTVFIEVQTGEYFGEDDIVRIEDDYNRI